MINTKPPKSVAAASDNTEDSADRKTLAGDDAAVSGEGAKGAPLNFQLYSELSKKVFGEGVGSQRQMLIASDGDGREEESDSSFEFDVTADDIYDLTFF